MLAVIEKIISEQGLFPAGTISLVKKKTQNKSLIKCECTECGFGAYITYKTLEECGTPVCPNDFVAMECG